MQNINEMLLEENQYFEIKFIQDEDGVQSCVRKEMWDGYEALEEVNSLKLCSNISRLTVKLVEELSHE